MKPHYLLHGLFASALLLTALKGRAADMTITINGRVAAKPCTVSTTRADVDLGELYASDFAKAGSVSALHDLSLQLSNCPTVTTQVKATFLGTSDDSGYFKNEGDAQNIQIELQDSDGKSIKYGENKQIAVDDATRSALFILKVRALSVNGGATQGSIKSTINVVYTYF